MLLIATVVAVAPGMDDEVAPATIPPRQAPAPATVPDLPDQPQTLDAAVLPPAPIIAACRHLLDAELQRIALPEQALELKQAIHLASVGANVSIAGDWSSLEAIGIRADDLVTLPTRAGSLPVILDQMLGLLSDAWDRSRLEATADGLVITSGPGAARLAGTMLHPIGDLLTAASLPAAIPTEDIPPTSQAMADLVRGSIEPDAWQVVGGSLARMQPVDEGLLVTAPPSIQIQVRRVLDQLRLGRPHEIEASIELVPIDAETARRLEASAGPGTVAAVRAVRRDAVGSALFETSVVATVDGEGAVSGCETDALVARVDLRPAWDHQRRRLRCRLSVELDGDSCDGQRLLTVDQEISVPVGGLVMPLPRTGTQSSLALLLIVRTR